LGERYRGVRRLHVGSTDHRRPREGDDEAGPRRDPRRIVREEVDRRGREGRSHAPGDTEARAGAAHRAGRTEAAGHDAVASEEGLGRVRVPERDRGGPEREGAGMTLTKTDIEELSERLTALGMHLDAERLNRAVAIVRSHGAHPSEISDMALLSICVEA